MEFVRFAPIILVAMPVVWLCVMAGYAYVDAPNHGMSPNKWAAISFFVPLFGFFAYLFEREERNRDSDDREMFTDGFEIHKSRRDDVSLDQPDESPDDEHRR
ncbi:MAG: hypothetical protein ACQET5_09390 [Halobacteriota archaeon]|uniref:hypothetical protein n=1 Tax=Natronomonas sp. TaxID=2184060 RepID=UPI00397664F6